MSISVTQTALLLVDFQRAFDHPTYWGTSRSTPNLEANISKLLPAFREAGAHIIHVRHHSANPGAILYPSADNEYTKFMSCAEPLPSEPILTKNVNSAFIGTNLEQYIRDRNIKRLVIVGLTTPHCVSTSTRMAANLGVVGRSRFTPFLGQEGDILGEILLIEDGCGMFELKNKEGSVLYDAETAHRVNLEVLRDEFCDIVTTEEAVRLVRDGRK